MARSMRGVTRGVVTGAAAVGAVLLFRPGSPGNRWLRQQLAHLGRRLSHLQGRVRGASYRLSGRRPDPTVTDGVVADRVRSVLGRVERRLDVPRVHVMVEQHVALLHGDVGREADATEIEQVVARVPGVKGVESYLHVGLTRGETRPSEGRAVHPASTALHRLLGAAEAAGVGPEVAPVVVRGILATFADRVPDGERAHLLSHLPADVRPLVTPPRRIAGTRPPRTVHDLVGRIVMTTEGLSLERAEEVTAAVVHELRRLVPEETGGVAAVLPPELRHLWEGDAAA